MWYVYILRCSDNTLYTGSTVDVVRRLKEHDRGKGGSYTRMRRPVNLVYKESLPDRTSAQKRENEIKGYSRFFKEQLIAKFDKRACPERSEGSPPVEVRFVEPANISTSDLL